MGLDNPLHLAVILLVVLLLFGAKRVPEIGRSLGSGIRGFRDSVAGEQAPVPAGTDEAAGVAALAASSAEADAASVRSASAQTVV